MNVEQRSEYGERRTETRKKYDSNKCYRLMSLMVSSMRAVIGIMGRIAGHSLVMRITIAGIRIRILAVSFSQIQEILNIYGYSTNILRKLLAELIDPVERQNTQRRKRSVSTE